MPPHAANLISYGVPFRLLADTPELLAQALPLVPHATHPDPRSNPEAQIFPITLATLATLQQDLMVHVANFAPDHVFLHAGVVAVGGRAIVLPGPSFAGKTTLTSALVRAGATYYSDEYAVLSPQGLIHPYTRDLQVRRPGSEAQTPTPVTHFGGSPGTHPIPAALIAFTEYLPGAAWSPTAVTPGLAVLEMLRHTIPVQRTPSRVLASLTALVAPARLLKSYRDEAPEAARHLLALLQDPA